MSGGSGRRNMYPAKAWEPPVQVVQVPAKPLEYQLVDLLGEEDISDIEREAIRVVVMLSARIRRREAELREQSEMVALQHDLDRVKAREKHYFHALMHITGIAGSDAAAIAEQAIYGEGPEAAAELERRLEAEAEASGETVDEVAERLLGDDTASGIEAPSGGETTKIGSTEGESPTVEDGDAQRTPQ